MKIAKYLSMILVCIFLILTGCMVNVPGPPVTREVVVEEDEAIQYYDDPVQGWYIPGYWTGGCINCGFWVNPFWTTNIIVLNDHWEHYHGAHRHILEQGHRHRLADAHKRRRDQHHDGKSSSPPLRKQVLEKDQSPSSKQQIKKPRTPPPPPKQQPLKKQEKKKKKDDQQ